MKKIFLLTFGLIMILGLVTAVFAEGEAAAETASVTAEGDPAEPEGTASVSGSDDPVDGSGSLTDDGTDEGTALPPAAGPAADVTPGDTGAADGAESGPAPEGTPAPEPSAEVIPGVTETAADPESGPAPEGTPTAEPSAEVTPGVTDTAADAETSPTPEDTPAPSEGTESGTETPAPGPEGPAASPTPGPAEDSDLSPADETGSEADGEPEDEPASEPAADTEPDVTVKITGNVSRVTYNGEVHIVKGFTAAADDPDYDVNKDFTFARENGAFAEQVFVGTAYMGLSADEFTNVNENFTHVAFEVTDGFVEVVPLNAVVEIEGAAETVIYYGRFHSVSGYTVKSIQCVYGPLDAPEFEVMDCSQYSKKDISFKGNAYAERWEPGISNMDLAPENFENLNPNFGIVKFVVTDGYEEIITQEEYDQWLREKEAEQRKVTIHSSLKNSIKANDPVVLSAELEGFGVCEEIRYQWEVDKGDGFEPLEDGIYATYTFPATPESLSWDWQLTVYCR